MRKIVTVVCAMLAGLLAQGGPAEPAAPGPLAVRIVPTSQRGKTGRALELYLPSQHFHVVVTNVSDRPLALWRDWCSWGYFSLSFIAVGDDGRSVAVTKKDRPFRKNFPDSTLIPPGDHMVFDDQIWENSPSPKGDQSRTIKLTAVYTIEADEDAKEHRVWTGRVSSPTNTYTLWR